MARELELRARTNLETLRERSRGPIVIEFAGSPKAGKTSTIGHVQTFFKRCGYRVEVVVERASVCPIKDKKDFRFNVWTACMTLAQLLERTQIPARADDPDILILDRGLFDTVCWLSVMERLSRVSNTDKQSIEQFALIPAWRNRITGVILMTAKPDDSMKREKGLLPVSDPSGSIMNTDVLDRMLSVINQTTKRLSNSFNILHLDTSSSKFREKQGAVCEAATDKILELVEDINSEEILSLERSRVQSFFTEGKIAHQETAAALVEAYSLGAYKARDQVEEDYDRIQALPVAVVRDKSGRILRLRRRERAETESLHQKTVVWAGGHVRKEDNFIEDPMRCCVVRELQEELRLSITVDQLTLVGAVLSPVSKGTSKHAAIVYEWVAPSSEVEVVLNRTEFFEKHGNSISGSFVDKEQIRKDLENGEISEEWSVCILKELIGDIENVGQRELFS